MCQISELAADFLEEPVPTTSPTNKRGLPFDFNFSIVEIGPFTPSISAFKSSREILYIASACSGISGRDQASGAGEKSSVLVSPATLNTVKVTFFGYSAFLVNQVASAHF